MTGVSNSTFTLVVTCGLALWTALIGATWKLAAVITTLVVEVKALKDDVKESKDQGQLNAANITRLQQRFNIPQASPDEVLNNTDLDQVG